tara:strand:- start:1382 stop:1945 length:564 start_codon:yes stop_codon:yes gene_type:complete
MAQSHPLLPQYVYLDLETTGLVAADNDILEIGIVDDNGETLLSSYVRPETKEEWTEAEGIHHITQGIVCDAPRLADLLPIVAEAVTNKVVVIYNAAFDTAFLAGHLASAADVVCCMNRFTTYYGEPDPKRGGLRHKSLTFAAEHTGYIWTGNAHAAVQDALATRHVWHFLQHNSLHARWHSKSAIGH